jgi:hypothetical protein
MLICPECGDETMVLIAHAGVNHPPDYHTCLDCLVLCVRCASSPGLETLFTPPESTSIQPISRPLLATNVLRLGVRASRN